MAQDYIHVEVLKTEKKRLELFMGVLILSIALSLVLQLFYEDVIYQVFKSEYSYPMVFSWAFVMFVGFAFNRRVVMYAIRTQRVLPVRYFWLITLFEFFVPASWLILGTYMEESPLFLNSPVAYIYYILIIVSSLHLDFKLSVALGLLVSVFYMLFAFWVVESYQIQESEPMVFYLLRSFMYLLSGFCAGFVASELRKRLDTSYSQMQEKQDIESLFSQHVSKEIVDALKERKDFTARMDVTVMFLDIRNFTRLVQHLTPEEVNQFQNQFFAPVIEIINEHWGTVHQIMGDGLMATFGAPISYENHQEKAWEAVQAIQKHVRKSSVGYSVYGALKIGVGMASGEVLVGNIGTESRKQFSISGITVIIASRLEQLNKELDASILITKELFDALGGSVDYEFIRKVKMKGLDQEVEVVKIS